MKDIVVVGGGPAGSAVAGMLAGSGYNVTVIEKHSEPGLPAHCAGLVTENTARFFGKDSDVLSRIRKGMWSFPEGVSSISMPIRPWQSYLIVENWMQILLIKPKMQVRNISTMNVYHRVMPAILE